MAAEDTTGAPDRQRVKTHSEVLREAEQLKYIIAEEARRRMLAGQPDPVATLQQGSAWDRKTVTQIAEAVGMKPRTFATVEGVYSVAEGKKDASESVREVAQQQLAALDAGETTPHARRCGRCRGQE